MEQNVNRNRKTKYGHKTWEKLGHGEQIGRKTQQNMNLGLTLPPPHRRRDHVPHNLQWGRGRVDALEASKDRLTWL